MKAKGQSDPVQLMKPAIVPTRTTARRCGSRPATGHPGLGIDLA